MNIKKVELNLRIYLIIFIVLLSTLYFTSYKIFNSYFTNIETSQNTKAITYFINNMDNSITDVKGIIQDYSNWDKSYDFLAGLNDEYIYNNFRQGTNTLKDLNLDFIIFTNSSNKILFSKYLKNIGTKEKRFENKLFETLQNYKNTGTVISSDNEYFIVVKSPVYESDGKGESNGYIYSGKRFDVDYLKSLTPVYNKIFILNKKLKTYNHAYPREFLKNLKLHTKYTPNQIINSIQIEDINSNYLFTIEAIYGRNIVSSGKNMIILFNIFITILLGLVYYLIVKQQKILLKQNLDLDRQVIEKTFKLNKTLKKLENKNKELFSLATTDSLTKIHNRRSFFELTKKAIKKSLLSNKELSILMIDLDNFKGLNDEFGHKIGDIVLIDFCEKVNLHIKKDTIFGRLGGEEFAITFPNTGINEAEIISEKIRKNIEISELRINDNIIKYTASFGLSSYEKDLSIDDILNQADELLYQAKKEGRNRIIRKNRIL